MVRPRRRRHSLLDNQHLWANHWAGGRRRFGRASLLRRTSAGEPSNCRKHCLASKTSRTTGTDRPKAIVHARQTQRTVGGDQEEARGSVGSEPKTRRSKVAS